MHYSYSVRELQIAFPHRCANPTFVYRSSLDLYTRVTCSIVEDCVCFRLAYCASVCVRVSGVHVCVVIASSGWQAQAVGLRQRSCLHALRLYRDCSVLHAVGLARVTPRGYCCMIKLAVSCLLLAPLAARRSILRRAPLMAPCACGGLGTASQTVRS